MMERLIFRDVGDVHVTARCKLWTLPRHAGPFNVNALSGVLDISEKPLPLELSQCGYSVRKCVTEKLGVEVLLAVGG